jgi:hypothetical protein
VHYVQELQKHFTCQFPILSDMGASNESMSATKKIFSRVFYGDYDLKEA